MFTLILEKLKNLSTNIYTWIAIAIGGVILYIVSLRNKISSLNNQAADQEIEKEEGDALRALKELDNEANKSEANYDSIRDAYLKQQSSDSSGQEKA